MVITAVAHGGDAAEEHLHPADDGEEFSEDAVRGYDIGPNANVQAAGEVQLEVDTYEDLRGKHEAQGGSEGGVDVGRELSAFVFVAEKVGEEGEAGAEDLEGDMEAGAGDL